MPKTKRTNITWRASSSSRNTAVHSVITMFGLNGRDSHRQDNLMHRIAVQKHNFHIVQPFLAAEQ